MPQTRIARRSFWIGCLLELLLAGVAAILSAGLHQPWLADLHWDPRDALWGLLGAAPLLVSFHLLLRSRGRALARIREFLETVVRPLFSRWSIAQLAVISALAGLAEELLFRGAIQGGLARTVGPGWALALASGLFGLAHSINLPYALAAGLIGLYLGGLWLATGNLLAPILTHAVYDFLALIYFLRHRRP